MIEIKVDQKDLDKLTKMLERIPKGMPNAVTRVAMEATNMLQSNISNRILRVRTGRLRASMQSKVYQDGEGIAALVGSGVRNGNRVIYANILERGGVIRPKNGKYLCIPIRRGSPEAIGMGMWNNVRTGKQKKAIAFSSKVMTYRKVTSVTIPAFRYMRATTVQLGELMPRLLDRIGVQLIAEAQAKGLL